VVFFPSRDEIEGALKVNLREALFGQKKLAAHNWRKFGNWQKNTFGPVKQRDIEDLHKLLSARYGSRKGFNEGFNQVLSAPEGIGWKSDIKLVNLVIEAEGGPPFSTLEFEAARFDHVANDIRGRVASGVFVNFLTEIDCAVYPSFLAAQERRNISISSRLDEVESLLQAPTALYLFACLAIDFHPDAAKLFELLLPLRRENQIVHPVARWLERIQTAYPQVKWNETVAGSNGDIESAGRLIRKWRNGSELPSSRRWNEIAASISSQTKLELESIKSDFKLALLVIRFLEFLLNKSTQVRRKFLPNFDPVSPFRDFPLMLEHARKVKAGLAARSSDEPQPSF